MDVKVVERRLAVIFAADMVGYSRLMEADEAGTLARLRAHRLELIDPGDRQEPGPDHQDRRRRHAGRVRQRHRGGRVRRRDPAPDGQTQRRPAAGALDPVPDRHQSRRRDHRGRRHLRRRRQRRRPARGAGGAGRHLRLAGGPRADRRPARRRLRGSGRADASRTSPGRSGCFVCCSTKARRAPPPGQGGDDRGRRGHGQALDRGAAVRQHERRSRAGVLRRRPDRGHHHRAVALSRPAR